TTNAKITPDELNMIFGAIAHSKNIIELHAFFYNGMFSYLTGSGFTADYFQDGVDYSNAVGADDPYIIARNPAEAVEYVSEFVRSCQNHGSYFSHSALQKIMGHSPMDVENLDMRLTIFNGGASTRYYIGLREDSDNYRGVKMDFIVRKMSSSSVP
ncbi:MAG TPA: hypothetical protein VJB05_00785, partial [archaeon]|nr:hypothetical protein [archaeon]